MPHTPKQNGVDESFMGTLKLERVWQNRFETYNGANATITNQVTHYKESRPHPRLDYLPPAKWRSQRPELSA